MKRIAILFLLTIVCLGTNAQKKNGTVYSEHELIDKTRALWTAFAAGEESSFLSYYADTVHVFANGQYSKRTQEWFKGVLKWWDGVSDKKIVDDKGTYPDAIVYEEGLTTVQDWLRLTGTHDKSGLKINVLVHSIYLFNEEGKIKAIHQYYDDSFFEKIAESMTTKENGKVFINHPYIVTVRKSMNAWASKDLDTWMEFFTPDAKFSNTTMKYGDKPIMREEFRKIWEKEYAEIESMHMKEMGYPDCIYYEKNDNYVVYSWWSAKIQYKDGKKIEYPIMISFNFNKEGKIESSIAYYSSNHFD